MDERIRRLLAPRSVALIGGAWTDPVAAGCRTIGYQGELWRVHPSRASTASEHYYRSVAELPGAPDAAFIAAPRREAVAVAAALRDRGAGGFVCFASGFSETGSPEGEALTAQLEHGAGNLPFLGPNCYGFVNYFDRVALWPDQVVGEAPERGVALICQSGTIALTLMFNDRSLPIGYLFTVGNQTRLAVEDLIEMLVPEQRVSAFGVYVEGIKDARRSTGARRGQADRAHQDRAHSRRRAHGAQPHRCPGRCRRGLRRLLPPGGHRALRDAGEPVRNPQAAALWRPARGPAHADHGRLGRRHGHDGRCRPAARAELSATLGGHGREVAPDPGRSGHDRQSLRFSYLCLVRLAGDARPVQHRAPCRLRRGRLCA